MKLSLLTFPTIPDILFRRLSFAELCGCAAENGLSGLDMMAGEVRLHGVKKLKREVSGAGLAVTCLIAHVPMTAYNEKTAAKKIAAGAELAGTLGCDKLMIVPMGQFEAGKLKSRDKEAIFSNYVRGYLFAATLCKNAGINVCVEDTPSCYLPLSSTEECARLLNAVGELGLVCDTANMLPGGSDPLEFYGALRHKITHVHLKDVEYLAKGQDRCADGRFIRCCDFGRGVVPVKAIYDVLRSDGYDGVAAIEYTPPRKRNAKGHREHIKEFVGYLDGTL